MVRKGESELEESMVPREGMAVCKEPGASVIDPTINRNGRLGVGA